MNDFKAEPPELHAAMSAAAARVFASGWYVLGNEVKAFEQRWAAACGTRHCAGVANGMDAIELALRGLDIGPGSEVVTTPMTAFATVLAVLRAGATPVLADIDPESGLMSPDSVRRCLSERTRAVVLVHLYGQMRDMPAWLSLCREAGIHLIEDCAQSHLAQWDGQAAGSLGTAGAYSFYPTKNLGAIGDGGALVTQSDPLAARVARLRNYGQSERYVHPELGMNSRLDELQAALLLERLQWLDRFTERRRTIAARYDAAIDNPRVGLLARPQQPKSHVHHLYVVTCTARAQLAEHLAAHGVQTLIHYPVPVHRQAPCAELRRDPLGLPHAEAHAAACLSIPCHPQMSDADVARVVEAVNAFR
ncbi:DegT/DnrJ/EryC1/StrS family aminotransferase [Piscinibacter sp. XHJ-5]|uniref:DegT/DnrJ/EryC1/StrS family aminotransferase n=1 Tax=Piscinibacter sp. XHJ-5 TaxID=3037797 RepID=UPI00245344C3|nr:DegT/DnrJ/EryC1/StrS family aminotransferase [Piscinibacter sp. XHJ-5]